MIFPALGEVQVEIEPKGIDMSSYRKEIERLQNELITTRIQDRDLRSIMKEKKSLQARRLELIYRLGNELSRLDNPSYIPRTVLPSLGETLPADCVLIFGGRNLERPVAGWVREGAFGPNTTYVRSLIKNVRCWKKALFLRQLHQTVNYKNDPDLVRSSIDTACAWPIVRGGNVQSIIYCDTRKSSSPLLPSDLKFMGVVGNMISTILENLKLHEAVQIQNRRLKKLAQHRREVFNMLAHDIRNPLTAIHGFAQLLNENTDEYVRNDAGKIVEMSDRIRELMDSLLELSKIEEGKIPLNLQPIVLKDIFKPIRRQMLPQAEKRNIMFITEGDSATVWADRNRLDQILSNLVGNALKFSASGDGVMVWAKAEGKKVRIGVTDTGDGMGAETQKLIFQPFEQGNHGRNKGGHGLGLAIVHRLVELHESSLDLESIKGMGSTFSFLLESPDVFGESRSVEEPSEFMGE